ncbi:MAG: enoyl-CoA hydratase/isomerase family protein [Candidatus Xenobia bacterium]
MIRRLRIDNPPVNVLKVERLEQWRATLREATEPVVVLEATSAGVDVRDHVPERVPAMLEAMHGLVRDLLAAPFVSVGYVDGYAFGGAFELLLACDLVVATERSTFGVPEIDVGCFPPVAAWLLPAVVGRHRAAELILQARRLSAQEALDWGLVNRVTDDLDGVLAELQKRSPAVLRLARQALGQSLEQAEAIYREQLMRTHDVVEGVQAFLQKRRPQWQGR